MKLWHKGNFLKNLSFVFCSLFFIPFCLGEEGEKTNETPFDGQGQIKESYLEILKREAQGEGSASTVESKVHEFYQIIRNRGKDQFKPLLSSSRFAQLNEVFQSQLEVDDLANPNCEERPYNSSIFGGPSRPARRPTYNGPTIFRTHPTVVIDKVRLIVNFLRNMPK